MSALKKGLMMAGASVVALGMFAPGAQAFSDLHWDYDLWVNGDVDFDIEIDAYLDPAGLIAVEALQVHLGDVTSKSIVTGVTNNAPNGEAQTYTVDLGEIHLEGYGYVDGDWHNTGDLVDANGNVLPNSGCDVNSAFGGSCIANLGEAVITIDGVGDQLYAPNHLPEVVSTATAVGNNMSIEGPTFTTFDVTQGLSGNWLIDTSKVDADSWVWDIQNASVDSAATAVGNNFNVNLEALANGGDDLIAVGDLTQLSHAHVNATSFVADVTVSNYTNLGSGRANLGRDLVSSVATAVGNNASISVSVGN